MSAADRALRVDLDADDENAALVVLTRDEERFAGFGIDLEQRQEGVSARLLDARAHDVSLRFALFLRLYDIFQRHLEYAAVRELGGRWLGFRRCSRSALDEFVAVVCGKRRLGEFGHVADLRVDACAVIRSV